MIAFVLGNGQSRKQIDIDSLKQYGTVYGCNAIYRDYSPDYLVAVDEKMVRELAKHKVDKRITCYTSYYNQIPGDFHFFPKHPGKNSGHSAMILACLHNHTKVYMIGFDYIGVDGLFNNVYADTDNYRKSTEQEAGYTQWYVELRNTLQSHPDTKFIRVVGNKHYLNLSEKNFTEITVEQFKELNK